MGSSPGNCSFYHEVSVHLPLDGCDLIKGKRDVGCSEGTPAPPQTSTASTVVPTGSTATQTVTFSTTTVTTEGTTTQQTPSTTTENISSTTTTPAGPATTTASAGPVTTTTPAGPVTTTTPAGPSSTPIITTTSGANALKSIFQMSHFFVVSILLMFLCW